MADRILIISLALLVLSCGGAAAQSIERRDGMTPAPSNVSVIYVTDFELDAEAVKPQSGLLPGPLGQVLRGGPSALKSPAERAHYLVDLMAKTLTNSLINEGINARRLAKGEPRPAVGWVVRGTFTHVDQGNRFERAAIGLGAGKTELTVIVAVDNLKAGTPTPMNDIVSGAHSSKMLGAAPGAIIRFNPAAVAAKFALSGIDLERNVVKTATNIATELAKEARK